MPESSTRDFDISALSETFLEIATLFSQWKTAGAVAPTANALSKKYRKQIHGITQRLLSQGELFQTAMKDGVKQAQYGQGVARDVVHLCNEIERGPSFTDIKDLLEDLQGSVTGLLDQTRAIQERLGDVRRGLHQIEIFETEARRDAGVAVNAERASRKSEAACAQVVKVIWDWFWTLPPVTVIVLAGAKAHEAIVKYKTKAHNQRAKDSNRAVGVFEELKIQVDKAHDAVGQHVDFWKALSDQIEMSLLDPARLLNNDQRPKLALVRKQREEWSEIQQLFREYGSKNLAALEHLQDA